MATKVRELAEATPNSSHPNPLISDDKLRQLYSMMLRCRLLDTRARLLRKQAGSEHDHHSSEGLEATAVGAAIDLRPTDTLAPSPRDFILSYLRGMPVAAHFSQVYWKNARPRAGRSAPDDCEYTPFNIILPTSTVDAQWNRCTDIALANQREKNGNVVVPFSCEGLTSLSVWHRALNFAGRRNLPIVFVRHQSVQSAASASVDHESKGNDTKSKAVDFGFPKIPVDGNDAVAVYRVAQEAVERARGGGGPTLIEAQTLHGHQRSAKNRAQDRATDEVEEREFGDPIAAMERYLIGKGLFSQKWKKEIVATFQQELDAALDAPVDDRHEASA